MLRGLRNLLAIAAALAALGFVVGCGDDDDETTTTGGASAAKANYVGKVSGTDAYIALVSDGKQVAGYVCDGKKLSVWIDASPISDGAAKLVSRKGESLGEATLSEDEASGSVTIEGASQDFSAEPASGKAGLYYGSRGKPGEPNSVEAGLIQLADGSFRANENYVNSQGKLFIEPTGTATHPGQVKLKLQPPGFINPNLD